MRYSVLSSGILLVLSIFFHFQSNGQTASFDELESKANALFSDQEFDKAHQLYSELMVYFPTDPEINYGYGVSGVQSGEYGQKVRDALNFSVSNSHSKDSYLYLGKSFHANNSWKEALKCYAKFEKNATKKLRKKLQVKSLIDQCHKKVNPFQNKKEEKLLADAHSDISTIEAPLKQEILEAYGKIATKNDTHDFCIPSSLENQELDFKVDDSRTYSNVSNFETEEGKSEFIKGWVTQMEIDSIENTLKNGRESYEKAQDPSQKKLLAAKIISLEKESDLLLNKKQEHFQKALGAEQNYWNIKTQLPADQLASISKNTIVPTSQKDITIPIDKDTLKTKETDSASKKFEPITTISDLKTEEFSHQTQQSSKENTTIASDITTDLSTPEIIFKVQVGAFKDPLDPDVLSSLERKFPNEVFGTYNHNGYFCLTIGEKTNYVDALKILKKYNEKEIKSLFIVAFKNSQRIAIKSAIKNTIK